MPDKPTADGSSTHNDTPDDLTAERQALHAGPRDVFIYPTVHRRRWAKASRRLFPFEPDVDVFA